MWPARRVVCLLACGLAMFGADGAMAAVAGADTGAEQVAPAPVDAVAAATNRAALPIHTESGKRYLLDAHGAPFFLQGDAAWSLIAQLTREQADSYLEDRRRRGFNAVLVSLLEHHFSSHPPRNARGDAPFLVDGDFSTPNEAYFAFADTVIADAESKGILVLLAPAYMGYKGGDQGWYAEMAAAGPARLRAYGRYVAHRFRARRNILWVQGGDFSPRDRTLADAVALGIRDIDPDALQTFHGSRGMSARASVGTRSGWLNVNAIYSDENGVFDAALAERAASPLPYILIEARYENEEGAHDDTVRAQAYQAALTGASGQVMGNNPVWKFAAGWENALDSGAARSMRPMREILHAAGWWNLVPDVDRRLLVAGVSSGRARAVGAITALGDVALVYAPSARAITVDLSRLSGPRVDVRWFDPTNGSYVTAAGSPYPTRPGPRVFVTPGRNARGAGDRLLVLNSTR